MILQLYYLELPKRNENTSTQRLIRKCSQQRCHRQKHGKTPGSVRGGMNHWNVVYSHAMEYYAADVKDETPIQATAWMNLKSIMLTERRQTQMTVYCEISLIWNFQKKAKLQRQKADQLLPGLEVGAGINSDYQGGGLEVMELFYNWIVGMTAQLLTKVYYNDQLPKVYRLHIQMGEFLWRSDTSIQLFKEGRGRNCLGMVFL